MAQAESAINTNLSTATLAREGRRRVSTRAPADPQGPLADLSPTSDNSFTRRSLIGAAVPLAVAASMPTAAAAWASPTDLSVLIDAHRAAIAAYEEAARRHEEADIGYDEATRGRGEVLVPCLVGATQAFSLSFGYDQCQSNIRMAFLRESSASLKVLDQHAPELAVQVRAVFNTKEAENIEILDRIFAGEEAGVEASGLGAARRALSEASDALDDAELALCSFRCRTIEEVSTRAEYMLTAPGLQPDEADTDVIEALLQSFLPEGGDAHG